MGVGFGQPPLMEKADRVDDSEITTRFDSLVANDGELHRRLNIIEHKLDTRNTFWLRRLVFIIDGWPRWTVIAEKPQWRPWRRWWTS